MMELDRKEERILGIDYGRKRIGIAVTDPLKMFASPLTTLDNDSKFWDNFEAILAEYKVGTIVLGYPLKESGDKADLSDTVERFGEKIKRKYNIPVELVDERYSSQIAFENMVKSITSKRKRQDKSLIDRNAAAVILKDYLDGIK